LVRASIRGYVERAMRGYVLALTLLGTACGSSSEPLSPATGSAGASPSSSQCTLPTCPVAPASQSERVVSLRAELVTTLQRNCTDRQCHGSAVGSAGDLYLGAELPGVLDTAQMIANTVDVPARTAPELPLIAAGDPERSFLMLKVDGCQGSAGLKCTAQPGAISGSACGDAMPQAQRPVCNEDRERLRTWILQGALDN
jgi:hypothetical protein